VSLTVFAYDAIQPPHLRLQPVPPRNELFGLEAWRRTVWGAPVMRGLGLALLPRLGEGADLVLADDDELDALEAELDRILWNLERVLAGVGTDEQTLTSRLLNAYEAIRLARTVEGGVVSLG
jgi:hypothetical protein